MNHIPLKQILFLDIETVSATENFELLEERFKEHWIKKASFLKNDEGTSAEDLFFERAAIYSEFGKVLVIGLGFLNQNENKQWELRVKSLANADEKTLLQEFNQIVEKFDQKTLHLCAHNGKEFDYPYLCRRMLVNGLNIPEVLDLSGKKPWEVQHLDTMEMWKFGDKKSYTSLDLLATLFGVSSSKVEMDGSQVNSTWYKEKDLDKIKKYCGLDVAVLVQLYLRMTNQPLIEEENIKYV